MPGDVFPTPVVMSLHFPFPGMLLPVPRDLIHIPETSPHPGWYSPRSVVGRCLWPNLMYLTLKQSEIIILSDLMLRIFIMKGLTGVLHAQWSDFLSYLHFQLAVIYLAWTCLGSNFSLIFCWQLVVVANGWSSRAVNASVYRVAFWDFQFSQFSHPVLDFPIFTWFSSFCMDPIDINFSSVL